MSEVLRVSAVGRAFGVTKALNSVSLVVNQGERLAVLGRSGSGKTTLLRLIAGLEAPNEGEILIAGRAASRVGQVLIPPERREVALVFQGLALFPNLRALDQIAFAARGRGEMEQAGILLDRVGLGHRASARLDELSGGERQRIALARAMAQKPKLILMDEPFASLDDEKRAEMRDLLRSLLESAQTTLIIVTHSRDDAFDLARRVVVFDHGHRIADDSLETLLTRPRHAAVARALGLGELIQGMVTVPGVAETAFGKVRTPHGTKPGPVMLLVRHDQPRLVTDRTGVEAEVLVVEAWPSGGRDVRRVAVVRVATNTLRVFAREFPFPLTAGGHVQVRIDNECEPVEGR